MTPATRSFRARTAGFRTRLLGVTVLMVGGATGGALYLARQAAADADHARMRQESQWQAGWLEGGLAARREAVTERCRALTSRALAILNNCEGNGPAELYQLVENAFHGLIEQDTSPGPEAGARSGLLSAGKIRFLDANGGLIPPPAAGTANDESWLEDLRLRRLPRSQETGYVRRPGEGKNGAVDEVILTPLYHPDGGEPAGAVAVFFQPLRRDLPESHDVSTGIVIRGQVHASTPAEAKNLARVLPEALESTGTGQTVSTGDRQWLAFSNPLNSGTTLPAAHQVSLYPLPPPGDHVLFQQWKIAGTGSVAMFAGIMGSLMLSSWASRRMAGPVEDLAADAARRRRAEMTERRYRSIFENAIEGIFLLTADGHFESVNPALASLCGFRSPRLMMRTVTGPAASLYVSPERFLDFLGKTRSPGAISVFELEMIRADGRRIWVSHNLRCVAGEPGESPHFEGSMEDVTENKRAAGELSTLNQGLRRAMEELRTTQQQIIQQERLRALGEMASGVAHDFNNALTPILGYSELLINRGGTLPPGEAVEYLKTINTAATDAASVVNRLREFYRPAAEQDVFHSLDLNVLVLQTITLTQPRWKDQARSRGVTISIVPELHAGLKPVEGDAPALREMLTNLIFNAVDAMPSGGTLTLRTGMEGDRCVLSIQDTGMGMTPEVKQRCLEPFFSTKGDQGTGLGLSMCFGIIQRHQGVLEMESGPDRGTTFSISFLADDRETVTPCSRAGTRHPSRPASAGGG